MKAAEGTRPHDLPGNHGFCGPGAFTGRILQQAQVPGWWALAARHSAPVAADVRLHANPDLRLPVYNGKPSAGSLDGKQSEMRAASLANL